MGTFVRLRQIRATHKELAERLAAVEKSMTSVSKLYSTFLRQLMEPPPESPKPPIGVLPPNAEKHKTCDR
jgi:hypothetical protein